MHKVNTFLISFILVFILGCEDKKTSTGTIPIENTTEVLNQPSSKENMDDEHKVSKKNISDIISKENTHLSDTFNISNMEGKSYTVSVLNQKVTLKEATKSIVFVTFFTTWCSPCVRAIPYMNDLQKKYQNQMMLTGILIHDAMPKEELRSFLAKHEVGFFVSNSRHNNDFSSLVAKTLGLSENFSIPLTVIYVEGQYFTHYEGIVPIEMMDYDIQQALKMIKQ